jgi:hypothetical protein
MTLRTRFLTLAFTGSMLALPACDSSDDGAPSSVTDAKMSPDARDGLAVRDTSVAPDAPGLPDAGADVSAVDGPRPIVDAVPLDAPAVDVAPSLDSTPRLDAGTLLDLGAVPYDGGSVDRYTFTIPDGRQFTMVDYCLPIRPLSSRPAACATGLDDAIAAAQMRADAGRLSMWSCREGLVGYRPTGSGLGWGSTCYYDVTSRALVAVISGSDTLTECIGSPEPNSAAFAAEVYGRTVTCSSTDGLRLDAGSVD